VTVLCRIRDMRLHLWAMVVTDYGDENPLYYDYYGFPKEFFEFEFKSHGDSDLANRIVGLYNKVGDSDLPRSLITLTYMILPGRVDRQDHTGFRASWHGWPGEKDVRF